MCSPKRGTLASPGYTAFADLPILEIREVGVVGFRDGGANSTGLVWITKGAARVGTIAKEEIHVEYHALLIEYA